jgi:hypothetical protein
LWREKEDFMNRRLVVSITLVGIMLLAGTAAAKVKKPDATLKLSEGSAAVGVGWSWGKGELTFKGKTYHFKVDGLSVAEVGVTKAQATGKVYNLKKLEDFSGLYAAAGAEGTAGKGAGASSLRNDHGVVINLKSTTKGANLKLAAEGIKVTLEK